MKDLDRPQLQIRLHDDSLAVVYKLSKVLAMEFGRELAEIHNHIPFQDWTEAEIVSDALDGRPFASKWDLSHFATVGGRICAINLAYERPAESGVYREDCIYMHRFAVSPEYRNRWLGRLFHAHALDVAFHHRPRTLAVQTPPVYGQTQVTPENAHVLRFYTEGCGFAPVGFAYYEQKVDVVLRNSRRRFYSSDHWRQLKGRRSLLVNDPE